VLLVCAGLLIRSFLRVLDVNLGFQPERAAAIRVDPDQSFPSAAKQNAYFDEVLRIARNIPSVQGAGLTDALPLGRNRSWGAGARGVVYKPGEYPDAFVRIVSDGYLHSMGIPLRAGRDISERDTEKTDPVIMINETMARTLWPGQNALGQFVGNDKNARRVVGIVGDVRHLALEQGSGLEMYIPIRQTGDYASVDLVVRTALAPAEVASAVRGALQSVAPNLPAGDFRVLQGLVDKAVSPRRFVVLLLGGFAAFALILASLGIYAVISYSVGQRTQEIGIRMALGASGGGLQARIVGQTLALAAAGMLIGTVASWVLARTLGGFLFGITPNDPATFAAMLAVLTIVAAVAGYLPARRASQLDPMLALRVA
jgi:predicted permease